MVSKPSRRVRAADVAAAAGVSKTAVSFALNDRDAGNLSPATKQRILDAAERLGYEPHHVARSLRSRTTLSMGLLTDGVASSPYGGRLLAAATERANSQGYALLVIDLHEDHSMQEEAIRELERRRVDGVIYATMGFRILPALPETRLPLVLANCTTGQEDDLSVYPDDAAGATVALDHLAGLGHRHVAMISGHHIPDSTAYGVGNVSGPIRRDAFLRAGHERGLQVSVVETGWEINDGYHAAMSILDVKEDRPSGLFAITDRAAIGALLAAARLGLSVPDDLSLVGFDDQEKLAECTVPPLTTVALPHARMGDEAMCMALDLVGGQKVEVRRRSLPCDLVVRSSTSSCRGGEAS